MNNCWQQLRNQLSIQLANLQVDFDNVSARLDEETENGSGLKAHLAKALNDYQAIKTKYDTEIVTITEELEDTR